MIRRPVIHIIRNTITLYLQGINQLNLVSDVHENMVFKFQTGKSANTLSVQVSVGHGRRWITFGV